MPPDPAGVWFIRPPLITPDGAHYVYSSPRVLSELFLARVSTERGTRTGSSADVLWRNKD